MIDSRDNIFKSNDLILYYHGSEKCLPGKFWGPAVKEHYKVHYIHSGKGIFIFNRKTYCLGEGQCFLIYPNTISYYQADETDPWTYSWVAFNGLHTEEYLQRAGFSKENPILNCKMNTEIRKCFSEMQQAEGLSYSVDLMLKSMLYLFLALIIEGAASNPVYEKILKHKDEYIRKVIDYIHINYSRKISVSNIAHHINLDRKYLSAIFKAAYGVTLQDYLVTYRTEKACSLLVDRTLTISTVARSIGYEDPLVFSRMFKKLKGVSPREYRNQLLLKQD